MVYEFRWEDIFNQQVRRRRRVEGQGDRQYAEFALPELAPTENLRLTILDNNDHGQVVGEILLKR